MKFSQIVTPILTVLILLSGSKQDLHAQERADGSVYSRFGVGELFQFQSSQIQGMGGGGTGLTSLNYVNLGNPATWADQQLTRLAGSVLFQGLEVSNAAGDASRLNSSILQAFQFSFPIRAGKLGAALSYTPYSRVAHRVQRNGLEIDDDPTLINAAPYSISFLGEGGLQKATLGLGYRPTRLVSFGASADFIFGIMQENRVTQFSTGDFLESSFSTTTRLTGLSSTLGALVSVPRVLNNQDAVSIGLSISTPVSLNSTQVRILNRSQGPDTLGVVEKGNVELPVRTNIGVAYYANTKWTLAANYTFEPWSNFESELPLPGFIPGGTSLMDDRSRFSLGAAYLPSVNPLAPYFQRVGFRIGFYSDSGYIKLNESTDLKTTAFTGGISLPTLFPGTYIDVNVELGRRGSTSQNLVRESFFKFHINVNIGERWFERRKLG